MAAVVTGLLLTAPTGATSSAREAVHKSVVSSSAPEERELERASRAEYWVSEFRRRWRLERRTAKVQARTIRRLRRQLEREPHVGAAICAVFGPYCGQALRVAWCESRYYTGAANGQYLGIFQMGSRERATYGHSASAIGQAMAAYRYFVASGKTWGPWECKP